MPCSGLTLHSVKPFDRLRANGGMQSTTYHEQPLPDYGSRDSGGGRSGASAGCFDTACWCCVVNFVGISQSQINFCLETMTYFLRFRRFALLLLSLTLSTQAMAVISFGACHQVKALLSATQSAAPARATVSAHAEHHSGSSTTAATHHKHDGNAHPDAVPHGTESSDSSNGDSGRVKCAACAACHLCSAVLPMENVVADIPKTGSTSFFEFTVPRVRNVANGLDRPPRA